MFWDAEDDAWDSDGNSDAGKEFTETDLGKSFKGNFAPKCNEGTRNNRPVSVSAIHYFDS
jgi:hypothetical protein